MDVRGAGRGFVPDLERHRQGTLTPVQRQEQFRCAGKNDVFRSRIPEKPEKENPKTFISTSQLACSSSRFAQARDILLHELITTIPTISPAPLPPDTWPEEKTGSEATRGKAFQAEDTA